MLDKKILITAILCIVLAGTKLCAQEVNTTPPTAGSADNMNVTPASTERSSDDDISNSLAPVVNAAPPMAGDQPASIETTGGDGADQRQTDAPATVPVQTINASPPKAPEE